MKLILASNSPRRRQILSQLNYEYVAIPAVGEEYTNAANCLDTVKELACRKALEVYKANPDAVVVGCDTIVDLDGKALGKPVDCADAVNMLTLLSGRSHYVHTGVCVMSKYAVYIFAETSAVLFNTLSAERIKRYVESGSPMDKAGAYGIQDSGFVAEIKGSYENVMGFPTDKIDAVLRKFKL